MNEAIYLNQTYEVNLSTIFEDLDRDPLSYLLDDGSGESSADVNYSFKPTSTGIYTFEFKAEDANKKSSDVYSVHLIINPTPINTPPNMKAGINHAKHDPHIVGTPYKIDLSTIFEDIDGDSLMYEVSVNGNEYQVTDSDFSYTPTSKTNHTFVFRAYDDLQYSKDTYTVILTVDEKSTNGGGGSSAGRSTKTIIKSEFTTEIPSSYIGKDKVFETSQDDVKVQINGLSLSDYKGDDVEVFIQKIDTDYYHLNGIGEFPENMPVFDISLLVDGVKVPFSSDVPLKMEFEVDGNYENHKMVAIYLKDGETYEILEGVFDGSVMTFTSNHLSEYALMYVDKTFSDSKNHWGKEAIEALAAREIVTGIGNDLFNPNGAITRAEFTAIMVRYFDFVASGTDLAYVDVAEDSWYAQYVRTAREVGILPDMYGDTFEPNEAITREEMMCILYKSLEITDQLNSLEDQGNQLSNFTDADMVSSYAIEASAYLISRNIINGNEGGTFQPTSTSTRAEVSQMVWNMIQLIHQ